ncbi:hypothetical protein Tco_0352816 [Tanacetum coccineum]
METNKSIDRSDVQKDFYKALVESYNSEKDIISSYGDVVTLKKGRDDQEKDEDPSVGSNRGSKRRRSGKEAESLKEPTHKESKSTSSSKVELEYHLEEVFKVTNDRLYWHNPEGKPYPHDLSKPLPLIQNEQGRQVIPWDYFINNDLKYLKGGSSSKKYTTSVTKTKAADYGQVKWIENKLSNLNLEERYALDVALRMFTQHIIIQEHVEDLNRLMRTDEFYKFSDGTLNHVRTAVNDIATGIEMDYFPQRK